MFVAPAVLAGSTGENGLKTRGMDPSGLPSITSVAEEEPGDGLLDDGLDELHAASPIAVATHAKAASGTFSLMEPSAGVMPVSCRRWGYRLRPCHWRGGASRPPLGPRLPAWPGAVAPRTRAWRGGIGGGSGSPRAAR